MKRALVLFCIEGTAETRESGQDDQRFLYSQEGQKTCIRMVL